MKKIKVLFLSLLFVFLGFSAASATSYLYDWAFNVDGTTYEDMNGDAMPMTGSLDGEGLGTLTWSSSEVGSHSFISFFDHEIDEAINTYYNEYGEAVNTVDAQQSWEIDEPGYVFGDIYDNVMAGSLDNTNDVPENSEDDVSWAMGWGFDLETDESATITLILSDILPTSGFYLAMIDPDSNETIYFSSTLEIIPGAPVPEPATLILLGTGLAGLAGFGRKKFWFGK